jgi:hypothetical protein
MVQVWAAWRSQHPARPTLKLYTAGFTGQISEDLCGSMDWFRETLLFFLATSLINGNFRILKLEVLYKWDPEIPIDLTNDWDLLQLGCSLPPMLGGIGLRETPKKLRDQPTQTQARFWSHLKHQTYIIHHITWSSGISWISTFLNIPPTLSACETSHPSVQKANCDSALRKSPVRIEAMMRQHLSKSHKWSGEYCWIWHWISKTKVKTLHCWSKTVCS